MNIRPKTALDYLIELLHDGMEFPDAAYKAATEFKVDQPTLEAQCMDNDMLRDKQNEGYRKRGEAAAMKDQINEHQTFPR